MTIITTAATSVAVIRQTLSQYGLTSLTTWAINEANNGATVDQITQDITTTPQFKARFPAIAMRVAAGLPAISPGDYVNYENTLAQMESQYGLPQGALTNKTVVTNFIAGDTSTSEVQQRVDQTGFQAIATAHPALRQYFTQTFGPNGDGALASYFLTPKNTLPILQKQVAAAQIGGTAAAGGVNVNASDAMQLAQLGATPSSIGSTIAQLQQTAPLYEASITEQPNLLEGKQGFEAQTGLSQTAAQEVINRQQQREAAFKGGGAPEANQYGEGGVGAASPI